MRGILYRCYCWPTIEEGSQEADWGLLNTDNWIILVFNIGS